MEPVNSKRVLIVTSYFYPENFKCNDIAFELQRRGYSVDVMTAIPNYPHGKFYKGYGIFKKRKERLNGVAVYRSFVIPRGKGSAFMLALNYLSYTFFASLKALWLGMSKKYDTIIVHEVSPVLVGIPAVIVKKIQKIPIRFWVLDLWPESLSAAGGINNRYILVFFDRLTRWIYRNSDSILIGSKGYRKSIQSKGDFDSKIEYFPNWVETCLTETSNVSVPTLPIGFNIMMAGNMGEAQDFPNIMAVAKSLKGQNINFVFVGDGRRRQYVEDFAEQEGISNQIHCLGKFPIDAMPALFKQADILFLALKNEPVFALTAPTRLQAYMAAGKPIVAMINGDGADLIRDADCGWSVPAEDIEALASLFLQLSKMDKKILNEKGGNGRAYSQDFFDFNKCMNHLEEIIGRHNSN